MDKHVLSPTQAGVPQGGIASPVLMNLTLNGLERHIKEAFPRFQGSQRTKVHVIRFADDFIITGRTRAFLEQEVSPLVEQFLSTRGLELSHDEDPDHAYRGRLRFPRYPRAQVSRQAPMYASQEKRARLSSDDPPPRETSEASHRWPVDSATQSGDSGLGAVSSARRQQTDLREGGSSHLYPAVAVGTAAAPPQIALVDQGEILSV